MIDLTSPLAFLDPRLAPHAMSAEPAWLWSADATRILWANATGAAMFDAPTRSQLRDRRFAPHEEAAQQIARLAATLSPSGKPRLERLRGFTTGVTRLLLCACAHAALADGTGGILVAAREAAGPALTFAERIRRLCEDVDQAFAIFATDGTLLHATGDGRQRLSGHATVGGFAETLAREAFEGGHASGHTALGEIFITRIGSGAATALAVTFDVRHSVASALEPDRHAAPTAMAATTGQHPPAPSRDDETPAAELRHPLRFVWQMDADDRFTHGSEEFNAIVGPQTARAFGRPWSDIVAELDLDPTGDIARALASHDTWSGITVFWPVDGSSERLMVELSGLPVYDRSRIFLGYRGFGVCREVERIAALAAARRETSVPVPFAVADPVYETALASSDRAAAPSDPLLPSTVMPAANVVPFRVPATPGEAKPPGLSPVERTAFRELARELTARLKAPTDDEKTLTVVRDGSEALAAAVQPLAAGAEPAAEMALAAAATELPQPQETTPQEQPLDERPLLDRLPLGILVYRLDRLVYANRAFLDWAGYRSLGELENAGGLDSLLVEPDAGMPDAADASRTLALSTPRSAQRPAEGRLVPIPWQGDTALALMLSLADPPAKDRRPAPGPANERVQADHHELNTILDLASDGVIMVDTERRVISANRSAAALFGCDANDLAGRPFADLFAAESRRMVLESIEGLLSEGVTPLRNYGREVVGHARHGSLVSLHMGMGMIGGSCNNSRRICAVLHDVTQWKKTEAELVAARQRAEKDSLAKSEFLAKVSHEIRIPLNSIIGFSEVMIDGRFGPLGNERYVDYLKDVRASGQHIMSLLNDLLDLSKIEAGRLDLTFVSINLNAAVQQCVALMQAQASRERVIIRTALPPTLPSVVADTRSLRQIAINLLSNSVKSAGTGGQVIISTALTDAGEVALRVRHSGAGMSEKDIALALEPFRQVVTATRWDASAGGLALPLTKALADANRARFAISSTVDEGTLIEVTFPATRVLKGA